MSNAERYRQHHIIVADLMGQLSDDDKLRLAQALNDGWAVGDFGVDSYDPEPMDKVLAKIKLRSETLRTKARYTTGGISATQTGVFDGRLNLTVEQIVERLNSQQCEIDRLKTEMTHSAAW